MAVSYARIYELLLKYVKDEKKAMECYDVVVEVIKEIEREAREGVKDDLRDELATKKDIALLEEKMNSMEERILRYVDNKFNQIKILILITLFAVIVLNPYAYEIVKAILK
ncbi:conserved hypothetical protein (plasmid) [Methanocaldococcus sp. FS406-22]|uniref:hypothetical protein n=1 Tax=Methanocaldococcus sp. (strain FS406-22) TaxID=644281 RepID=UPI0001BF10B8|nr:hypothetical protein [Methanocaldococcus sp. FS406-22]ADC70511.1 conserved hypothetical protein [Methanocaldococcus sp. FS406-22]